MRSRWPLIALLAANLLAAATIFLAGKWVGTVDSDGPRWSECRPIDWTGRAGVLCFPDEVPIVRTEKGGEA